VAVVSLSPLAAGSYRSQNQQHLGRIDPPDEEAFLKEKVTRTQVFLAADEKSRPKHVTPLSRRRVSNGWQQRSSFGISITRILRLLSFNKTAGSTVAAQGSELHGHVRVKYCRSTVVTVRVGLAAHRGELGRGKKKKTRRAMRGTFS
jgi:hypothetical protein